MCLALHSGLSSIAGASMNFWMSSADNAMAFLPAAVLILYLPRSLRVVANGYSSLRYGLSATAMLYTTLRARIYMATVFLLALTGFLLFLIVRGLERYASKSFRSIGVISPGERSFSFLKDLKACSALL